MDFKLNQIDYWNKVAWGKTFSHPIDFELFKMHVSPKHKILDYGCGYGRSCDELWRKGYKHIIGIDYSKAMIERGKLEFPYLDLNLIVDSVLPLKKSSFNAVLLFSLLTCVPFYEDQHKIIKHILQLLKPGGLLYISDILIQKDPRNVQRYEYFKKEYGIYGIFELPDGGIFRHYTLREIKSLTADFRQIKAKYIDIITMNGNPAKGFQYFCKK